MTAATHERAPVFAAYDAGLIAARVLRILERSGVWALEAWVLMPNHVHLLVALRRGTLGDAIRAFKQRSARQINAVFGMSGPLWQTGYHHHAVSGADDLAATARYIVAKPLRAGLVDTLADYPLWDARWL